MNPEELSVTLDEWREQLAQDPNFGPLLQEASQELAEESPPKEFIETLIEMLYETLEAPESYPMVRDEMIQSGAMDEEDIPPEFNEKYIMLMMCALDLVRDNMLSQGFARGGLASLGRNGDSMLAHINPIEARMLIRNGGSGTINPETGLPEFGWASKTWKKVKKTVKKIAKPILTIASIIPGPWQVPALATNAAYNASQGNWLGAGLSAFGAYAAPGGFGGFGEAGGAGISGGLDTAGSFGGLSGATEAASGLSGATEAASGLSGASEVAGMAGATGSGLSGGLATPAFESLSTGLSTATPSMADIGALGSGVEGSLADLGTSPGLLPQLDPDTMDKLNMGRKVIGYGRTANSLLNPPKPQEFGQSNTQRQMQQLGGLDPLSARSFGMGGQQSRGFGQMARFCGGGLAQIRRA